ncbi:MAG: hypothetical protein ACAH17_02835 [Candidatus Paceibacterota bacterium]
MFSYIDSAIIWVVQKLVTALELHTSRTKNDVAFTGILVLFIAYFFWLVSALGVCILMFVEATTNLIQTFPSPDGAGYLLFKIKLLGAFTSWVTFSVCFSLLMDGIVKTFYVERRSRPQSAQARRPYRYGEWTLLFLGLSVVYADSPLAEIVMPFSVAISFCIFCAVALLVEYVLCASSLPPGEKERRKQEREMRNMRLGGV